MSTHQCFCVLIIIFSFIGVCTNEIRLTPTRVYAKENSSTTLTCSKTNGALIEARWQNSHISGDANLIFYNGKCIATRWLLDNDLFDGVCNGDGTYSLVLKRITRTQHGAEWICKETIESSSNEVVINVYVPATSVTLSQTDNDYMMENQTEKITCNTSPCRPDPRVQWYLRNSTTGVIYNLTTFSTQTYVYRENGLKASKSALNFKQNRTVNGFRLYCEVWTQSDIADTTSKEIIVNITYPPNNYPEIHGVESNIIEADTGTFVCLVAGGNPPALLSWNCFGRSGATFETNGNIVLSTIKWTALRGYNTCSCQAKHLNNWKRTTNATVNVLYPPAKPHFTIGSTIVFGDVRIIRNNTLQVICKSESNPSPNYTWTGPGISSKDGDTLTITSVKMIDEGLYKCNASNRMTRSNNSYIDRSNSSSFNLIMLYYTFLASNPKLKETLHSTNTGALIGVGVGTCFATIAFVAIVLIGYMRFKKLKFSKIKGEKKSNKNESQLQIQEESQVPSVYTDLDGNHKNGNVYDEVNVTTLNASSEQQDLASQSISEYVEMKNRRVLTQDTLDYINIRI